MGALGEFLRGEGDDARGRRHADLLAMDDAALEARHDYVQWLFPLPEPSAAVPGSPVLAAGEAAALAADPAVRERLAAAAARMRRFYAANDHWLVPFDHNHLRITRIIRSLRLLAGDAEADAFRAFAMARVREAGDPVNARSLAYWRDA